MVVAPSLQDGDGVGPVEVRGRRRPYYYVDYPTSRFHAREVFKSLRSQDWELKSSVVVLCVLYID